MRTFVQKPHATPQQTSVRPIARSSLFEQSSQAKFQREAGIATSPAEGQEKLVMGSSGDSHEQEADRVSQQVMRTGEVKQPHRHQGSQMGRVGASQIFQVEAPPIVRDVLCSPGQPIDAATRAFMEPRFGLDFSRVRIHADARAAESARSVHASAYNRGPACCVRARPIRTRHHRGSAPTCPRADAHVATGWHSDTAARSSEIAATPRSGHAPSGDRRDWCCSSDASRRDPSYRRADAEHEGRRQSHRCGDRRRRRLPRAQGNTRDQRRRHRCVGARGCRAPRRKSEDSNAHADPRCTHR